MPTREERLIHVTSKIRRAKQHVDQLEREIRQFLDANPYKIAVKRDQESRRPIYYVSSVEPTSTSLSLVAGDVIQNLMVALDHLAYQIVCHDTVDNPPHPNAIYFPITDEAAKYEVSVCRLPLSFDRVVVFN